MPDEDYPAWLWEILPKEKNAALAEAPAQDPSAGHEIDFVKEKKRLRAV